MYRSEESGDQGFSTPCTNPIGFGTLQNAMSLQHVVRVFGLRVSRTSKDCRYSSYIPPAILLQPPHSPPTTSPPGPEYHRDDDRGDLRHRWYSTTYTLVATATKNSCATMIS